MKASALTEVTAPGAEVTAPGAHLLGALWRSIGQAKCLRGFVDLASAIRPQQTLSDCCVSSSQKSAVTFEVEASTFKRDPRMAPSATQCDSCYISVVDECLSFRHLLSSRESTVNLPLEMQGGAAGPS